MKPYLRSNKLFLVQLRSSYGFAKLKILVKEFAKDIHSMWRYGAPFPTFLKLIGSLLLCLLVVMPLLYPFFIAVVTYFTFESLILSWWQDQPSIFTPFSIGRRIITATFRPYSKLDMWKVREVMTRGILVAHSLSTSIDYLCVMQGLLDDV